MSKEQLKKPVLFCFDLSLMGTALIFIGPHISQFFNAILLHFNIAPKESIGIHIFFLCFTTLLIYCGVQALIKKRTSQPSRILEGFFFTFFTLLSIISCFYMSRLIIFYVSFPKIYAIGIILFALAAAWFLPRPLFLRKPLLFLSILLLFDCAVASSFPRTIDYSDLVFPESEGIRIVAELPADISGKTYSTAKWTKTLLGLLISPKQFIHVTVSPQEEFLFVGVFDYHTTTGSIKKLDINTYKEVASFTKERKGYSLPLPVHIESIDRVIAGFWSKWEGDVYSLKGSTLEKVKEIKTKFGQVQNTKKIAEGKILVTSEQGSFMLIDYDLQILKEMRLPMIAEGVTLDDEEGIIVVVGAGGNTLTTLNRDTLDIINARRVSIYSWGSVVETETDRIFLTRAFFGDMLVCDEHTLKTITKIPLEPGVRNICHMPQKKLIAAGNYFNGNVYLIDTETYEVVRTVWVGSRIRKIEYASSIDRLYVSTGLRIVEMDLNKFVKRPDPPSGTKTELGATRAVTD